MQNRISFYQNVAETKDNLMKRFVFLLKIIIVYNLPINLVKYNGYS